MRKKCVCRTPPTLLLKLLAVTGRLGYRMLDPNWYSRQAKASLSITSRIPAPSFERALFSGRLLPLILMGNVPPHSLSRTQNPNQVVIVCLPLRPDLCALPSLTTVAREKRKMPSCQAWKHIPRGRLRFCAPAGRQHLQAPETSLGQLNG
jgi:hypothetical protein